MEEEDGVGLDLAALRDWVSYAWASVRRHGRAIAATTAAAMAVAALVSWSVPDRYYAEARVLAQRPDVLAVLSPGRLAMDASSATRSVSDLVERRDNLVALVDQTGLVQHWRETEPWTARLQGRLGLGSRLDDEQVRDMLVARLEDSIEATSKESSVALGIHWDDPDVAFRLLDVALQNFLEMRHVNEMAILGESISLLEERLGEAQRGLDDAMAGVRSLPSPRRATRGGRGPTSLDLVRVLSVIAEKRRAMEDLVSMRNRRIAELQTRLTEQRAIYAESHPAVENIKRSLEALQADSPQVAALRQELQQDESRYLSEGGSPADLGEKIAGASSTSDALIDALGGVSRDPSEDYARSRMATALAKYYSVADRLEALRLQRDAARASIKYRYLVVRPPLRPGQPENRTLKQLIVAAGTALGGLLGVLAAVGLDVRRGRIDEAWQVERLLGLPILAEPPAASRPAAVGRAVPAAAERPSAPPLREQEGPI